MDTPPLTFLHEVTIIHGLDGPLPLHPRFARRAWVECDRNIGFVSMTFAMHSSRRSEPHDCSGELTCPGCFEAICVRYVMAELILTAAMEVGALFPVPEQEGVYAFHVPKGEETTIFPDGYHEHGWSREVEIPVLPATITPHLRVVGELDGTLCRVTMGDKPMHPSAWLTRLIVRDLHGMSLLIRVHTSWLLTALMHLGYLLPFDVHVDDRGDTLFRVRSPIVIH